jgi:hypothetical protein
MNPDFKTKVDTRLEEAKSALIEEFHPQKIILFGSFARGAVEENSSIDILIIADTDLSFYERIKRAIKVSRGIPPIDPLVYTPQEVAQLQEEGDYFLENILGEGIVLYP